VKPPLKLVLCSALLLCCLHGFAQGVDVTAQFTVASHVGATTRKSARNPALNDIVLWLTPVDTSTPVRAVIPPKNGYRLVQKDKMFAPHLLVVPAGSSVEFPNLDPFFHNVFSLFNGKRFDLGLYESGTHRSVRFEREGVSYIFCNIHPEMGAIVLALKSPYFGLSSVGGAVTIHDVPPGNYHLHVWGEQFQAADAAAEQRVIQVTTQGTWLGPIELAPGPNPLMNHKNKFGEDYPATPPSKY
jgi:plastocyanin